MEKLPLPLSGSIRHICHISDLHIRPGTDNKQARYDEYTAVFDRIAVFLSQHCNGDTVVVITGDIVHDNKKAGATCIELFYTIIQKLANIAPVYIIKGNHDYNQSSVQSQDMIRSLMCGLAQYDNIAYLERSGHYIAGNVGFGIVAIQDALEPGNTFGRVAELPSFPDAAALGPDVTKIALFHGDVPHVYPIDWFGQGYDYILLGDIHRLQIYNGTAEGDKYLMEEQGTVCKMNTWKRKTTPMWGFPGSTIQQNFGETISGHGFLMWDLQEQTATAYHVPNDYGFVTTQCRGNKWMVNLSYPTNTRNQDHWIDAEKAIQQVWFPKTIRLRIKKDGSDLSTTAPQYVFSIHGITIESSNEETVTQVEDNVDFHLGVFNDPRTWCEYVEQMVSEDELIYRDWKMWFNNPTTLFLNCKHQQFENDVRDRNTKIQNAIDEFKTVHDVALTNHTRFALVYMNWAFILCYMDECHFDFKALHNQVHCIGGKNGDGKTSFLEAICIALFGEGFPSRSNRAYSASIICAQLPPKKRAFTSMIFEIDGQLYRIRRTFENQMNKKLHSKDIYLESYNNSTFEVIHGGKKATTEWMNTHVGTVDSFLTSCIVTQNLDQDFFKLKQSDQKTYLDQQLRLNSSNAFALLLKAASNAYDDVVNKLDNMCQSIRVQHDFMNYNPSTYDDTTQGLSDCIETLETLRTKHHASKQRWNMVCENTLIKGRSALEERANQLRQDMIAVVEPIDELLQTRGVVRKELDKISHTIKRPVLSIPMPDEQLPLESLEYIQSKLKGCTPTSAPRRDMDVLLEEREVLQLQIAELMETRPPSATYSQQEFLDWQSSMQSLETLEKNIETPAMTKNEIQNAQRRLDKWLAQKQIDPNDLAEQVEVGCSELLKLTTVYKRNKKELEALVSLVDKHEKERFLVLAEKPHVPKFMDTKERAREHKKFVSLIRRREELNALLDGVNIEQMLAIIEHFPILSLRLQTAESQLQEKRGLLESCERHDFNPDCYACMSHPWKKRLDEFEIQCKDLGLERLQILTEMDTRFGGRISSDAHSKEHKKLYDTLLTVIDECTYLESFWKDQKQIEDNYQQWVDLSNKIEDELSACTKRCNDHEETCQRLSAEVEAKKNAIRELEAFQQEWNDEYKQLLDDIDFNTHLHTKWDLLNHYTALLALKPEHERQKTVREKEQNWLHAWQQATSDLESCTQCIKVCEVETLFEKLVIHHKWVKWNDEQETLKARDLVIELDLIERKVEASRMAQVDKGELDECVRALDVIGHYQETIALENDINTLDTRKQKLMVLAGQQEHAKKKHEMSLSTLETVGAWHADISTVSKTLKSITTEFLKFKDWVLEKNIVPVIQKHVNSLLQVMSKNHRPLQLECVFEDKTTFNWLLRDGLYAPPLEKSSGFQRFVVGLAMRIVLGRLGVAGIKNTQLFIDEGFTACDTENLENIPEVLTKLLEMFDAIIIVSHLDELKHSVRSFINIIRHDGLSQIQFGQIQHAYHVKKRS